MEENFDYINLIDIAIMNLNEYYNNTIELYKKEKNLDIKKTLIKLIYDRNKIFLFDKETIKKYL